MGLEDIVLSHCSSSESPCELFIMLEHLLTWALVSCDEPPLPGVAGETSFLPLPFFISDDAFLHLCRGAASTPHRKRRHISFRNPTLSLPGGSRNLEPPSADAMALPT